MLLIDENISYRVSKQLNLVFEGSVHVSQINLSGTKGRLIWEFARKNGLTILTHDTDFVEMAQLLEAPPKEIKIREGNLSNRSILTLLKTKQGQIHDFITLDAHKEMACLII